MSNPEYGPCSTCAAYRESRPDTDGGLCVRHPNAIPTTRELGGCFEYIPLLLEYLPVGPTDAEKRWLELLEYAKAHPEIWRPAASPGVKELMKGDDDDAP